MAYDVDIDPPNPGNEPEEFKEEFDRKYNEYKHSGVVYLQIGSREKSISTLESAIFYFDQACKYALDKQDEETCKDYIKECSD